MPKGTKIECYLDTAFIAGMKILKMTNQQPLFQQIQAKVKMTMS